MTEIKYVSAATLREKAKNALASAGVREDIIEPVVEGLVWTSLRGIDSHGIRLLPHYIAGVKGGRINPDPAMTFEQTAPATGLVDADHTFGHAAGMKAITHAIELAKEAGMGAVGVKNSSHCGAMSWFAHEAANNDLIGLAFTNVTPRVKTPGSTRPFFGNNPICFVAPMLDEEPFSFDAATTSISFNAVKAAASAGKEMDPGLVTDAHGRETTDPMEAEMLLPIGSYKGFGLSMIGDILCSMLSGMPGGNQVSNMFDDPMDKKRLLGHFFCAIRIDCFRDPLEFKSQLQETARRIRSEPLLEAGKVRPMVPGDPEKQAWAERINHGIPVPEYDLETIKNS